jgi:protein-tyrosine phosphatase
VQQAIAGGCYGGVVMRVLFVCMGNICRSPTAQGVFRRVFEQRAPGLHVEFDSAGTHGYHIGAPPDRRAIEAARRRGIDLSELRARLVEDQDFASFDLLLVMDRSNAQFLLSRAAPEYKSRVRLVMQYAADAHRQEVPDPYYGGAPGFEEVLDLLEQAANGLVTELLQSRPDA